MRTIPEREAEQLSADLLSAAQELREHAAQHLYRADACKAVGERILATYHRRHAELIHAQANDLTRWRQFLAQRTSPVPVASSSVVRKRPTAPDIPAQTRRVVEREPNSTRGTPSILSRCSSPTDS